MSNERDAVHAWRNVRPAAHERGDAGGEARMTGARILVRDELRRGAYLAVWVPWNSIEAPENCETTLTVLCAEISAILRAMADPEQAAAALLGLEDEG